MKIKRKLRQEEHINVVPFIDILLVLLIFFMVSSRFTHNAALQLNLPQADAGAQQQPEAVIEISVNADGSYAINGQSVANSSAAALRQSLHRVAGERIDTPLILSADANATHQSVVRAMDVAGQLGFSKLSITTVRDEKSAK